MRDWVGELKSVFYLYWKINDLWKSLIFFKKTLARWRLLCDYMTRFRATVFNTTRQQTKTTWSLKTKFAQMYPGQDWPGRDATVEKLVPGNIKLVYLTRGKTAIKCSRIFIDWEFDSGSERTLAAWIRHASRTGSDRWVAIWFCWWEWRKGEDNMGNLPLCWG